MDRSPAVRRVWSLREAMILVAVLALGFGLFRETMGHTREGVLVARLSNDTGFALRDAVAWVGPWLVAVSAGVVALRLLPPRPRWRRLTIQPGWTACLSALVVVAAEFAWFEATTRFGGRIYSLYFLWPGLATTAGYAVATTWLCQALSRRWAAEKSLIDRVGRLAGFIWIAAIALGAWE